MRVPALSVAASAQSSSSACSDPSGIGAEHQAGTRIQLSLNGLTGDGTARRSSLRVPAAIAAACSACVGNTRTSTAAPASTSAGKPRTACAAAGALDRAGQLVEVVGPGAQPGPFQVACHRLGDGPADRRGELRL